MRNVNVYPAAENYTPFIFTSDLLLCDHRVVFFALLWLAYRCLRSILRL